MPDNRQCPLLAKETHEMIHKSIYLQGTPRVAHDTSFQRLRSGSSKKEKASVLSKIKPANPETLAL